MNVEILHSVDVTETPVSKLLEKKAIVVNDTQCRNNYEDSDIPSYSGRPLLFICLAYIDFFMVVFNVL